MSDFVSLLMRILGFAGLLGLFFWIFAGWWKRSDDRPALLGRWLFTLADLLFLGLLVGPMVRDFSYTAAFIGVPMAALGGLVMAMIWVPEMTAIQAIQARFWAGSTGARARMCSALGPLSRCWTAARAGIGWTCRPAGHR